MGSSPTKSSGRRMDGLPMCRFSPIGSSNGREATWRHSAPARRCTGIGSWGSTSNTAASKRTRSRQVLALLAGAEEAHGWVFGAGRKADPAGGVLTPLAEQFGGLEIGLIARLLDQDRPGAAAYDRIDPGWR